MRINPFPKVNCSYGAPMGRHNTGHPGEDDWRTAKLCARRAANGGDYDTGGAYWGRAYEVWAVWKRGKPGVMYVRAKGRQEAIQAVRNG